MLRGCLSSGSPTATKGYDDDATGSALLLLFYATKR